MKPLILINPLSTQHNTGDGHPESAARITALEELFETPTFKDYPKQIARAAELETTFLGHDEDYIFDLQDQTPDHGLYAIDGDTILSPASFDTALHGVGAVCAAVDAIFKDETKSAFCASRPPGHHAEPNTAMGFCLMNSIFIGARYAQENYDIPKIAIVDFDIHHGNGTDTMCRRHNKSTPDKPIFYISTHGNNLFPQEITGTGDPKDNDDTTLNIHLPDHCNSAQFRAIYENQVFPALEKFAPDFLMLSAGFDAHKNDPLAGAALETEDYGWLTRHLVSLANKHCDGRLVSVLEGGYDIPALTSSVSKHLTELSAN